MGSIPDIWLFEYIWINFWSMNNSRFSGSRVSQTKLYKKNGDVMLTLKAYNGRCVMEWLAVRVYEAYLNPQYAAFDPTRFCSQIVCLCESETGMRFCCWSRDGGQRFMFHQFVLQHWAHMHAIANNIKGVRWLSRHKFAIPHLYVFIGAKFLQKKKWIPGLPSLYAEEVCCEIHWIGGKVWSVLEAWRHQILLEQQKSINYLMKSQTVRMVDG